MKQRRTCEGLAPAFDSSRRAARRKDLPASARVNQARNLLLNPNYHLSEISSELGFDSVKQFQQVFERITGEPLRAYRIPFPRALPYRR